MKVTEKMDPIWTSYDTALAIFSLRSIQSYMDFIQYCTSNQLKINTITSSHFKIAAMLCARWYSTRDSHSLFYEWLKLKKRVFLPIFHISETIVCTIPSLLFSPLKTYFSIPKLLIPHSQNVLNFTTIEVSLCSLCWDHFFYGLNLVWISEQE